MYSSDTAEPIDTPAMAPAEPWDSATLWGRCFEAPSTSTASATPATTLNSTSSTSSTVVGIMLPLPWQ